MYLEFPIRIVQNSLIYFVVKQLKKYKLDLVIYSLNLFIGLAPEQPSIERETSCEY